MNNPVTFPDNSFYMKNMSGIGYTLSETTHQDFCNLLSVK